MVRDEHGEVIGVETVDPQELLATTPDLPFLQVEDDLLLRSDNS